jgi:hypothetical protein
VTKLKAQVILAGLNLAVLGDDGVDVGVEGVLHVHVPRAALGDAVFQPCDPVVALPDPVVQCVVLILEPSHLTLLLVVGVVGSLLGLLEVQEHPLVLALDLGVARVGVLQLLPEGVVLHLRLLQTVGGLPDPVLVLILVLLGLGVQLLLELERLFQVGVQVVIGGGSLADLVVQARQVVLHCVAVLLLVLRAPVEVGLLHFYFLSERGHSVVQFVILALQAVVLVLESGDVLGILHADPVLVLAEVVVLALELGVLGASLVESVLQFLELLVQHADSPVLVLILQFKAFYRFFEVLVGCLQSA